LINFASKTITSLKTKKIYLIRHGETDFNKLGIVQGSGVDTNLNEKGIAQAEAFFEHYQHIPFDKIYTSVLKRSIQSVQLFIDKNIPHEKHEGLNEICWGNKEGRKATSQEDEFYLWMLEEWQKGNTDLRIEGGESPLDVVKRQKPVLDLILSREEEENILICMHGRAIRILLCLMLNYEISEMDKFEHYNLCLYKLTYTGTMFTLDLYADTKHLVNVLQANI
jgi:probable phosphoglycerate mutase